LASIGGSAPQAWLPLGGLLTIHTTSPIGRLLIKRLLLHLQVSPSEWSAPLFFTVYSVGVGLTLGFAHMESVILLNSDDGINGFLDKVLASRRSAFGGA